MVGSQHTHLLIAAVDTVLQCRIGAGETAAQNLQVQSKRFSAMKLSTAHVLGFFLAYNSFVACLRRVCMRNLLFMSASSEGRATLSLASRTARSSVRLNLAARSFSGCASA